MRFANSSKVVTKISNAIKATETSTQVDDNVSTIIRKLQGRRATPLLSEEQKAQKTAEGKTVNQISVSQLSFDSKIENLDKLIKLLASIPLYAPNENELKVATLTTLYTDLKTKNTAVITALAALNTALISRNEILYKPITGLVELAIAAKTYIKSIYGASSPQYTLIGKLGFKTYLRN
jgi:phosphatidate phosphatase PAH1